MAALVTDLAGGVRTSGKDQIPTATAQNAQNQAASRIPEAEAEPRTVLVRAVFCSALPEMEVWALAVVERAEERLVYGSLRGIEVWALAVAERGVELLVYGGEPWAIVNKNAG